MRLSSFWIFGAAIETIVWSMNVIATAKIIAARTRFLGFPPLPVAMLTAAASSPIRPSHGQGSVASLPPSPEAFTPPEGVSSVLAPREGARLTAW